MPSWRITLRLTSAMRTRRFTCWLPSTASPAFHRLAGADELARGLHRFVGLGCGLHRAADHQAVGQGCDMHAEAWQQLGDRVCAWVAA